MEFSTENIIFYLEKHCKKFILSRNYAESFELCKEFICCYWKFWVVTSKLFLIVFQEFQIWLNFAKAFFFLKMLLSYNFFDIYFLQLSLRSHRIRLAHSSNIPSRNTFWLCKIKQHFLTINKPNTQSFYHFHISILSLIFSVN